MSALAGIVHTDPGRPLDQAAVARLGSVLAPYGKDAQNRWSRAGVLLIRSLMRTTPEDRLDRQPLVSPVSGHVIVFDGRLDNREELAADLGMDAAMLRLQADSALAARALDAWGEAALARLLGDFALASWDPARRRLLLARDAVGYRPLFWYQADGCFAFASLPKFLFVMPGVPRQLREDALHDYLCLMPTEPQATLFKDIYRLEPGQYLVLEDGKPQLHRYHRFGDGQMLRLSDPREYVDGLAEQLEKAVAPRLRAIGPLACELSSGLDSSTVAAVAARQLDRTGQRLLAFTAVLPEAMREGPVPAGYHRDESRGAKALAAMYANIDHVLVESVGHSPLHRLEARIEAADRPVLNPCNANWVQDVEQAATVRGVRVLLNGWQGNLTISHDGRSLLQSLFIRGRFLSWLRVVRAMKRRYPWLPRRWFVEFSIAPHVPDRWWAAYQRRRGGLLDLKNYSAVSSTLQAQFNTRQRARRLGHDLMHRGNPNGVHFRIQPLYQIEFAETCLGMNASGLDPRSPTMDKRLIEYCLSVPETMYLRHGEAQWLVKELGRDLLPEAILGSRTRGYQGADWFDTASAARSDLRDLLRQFRQHDSVGRYLDLDEMERLLDEWPDSGWHRPEVEMRYRNKLLRGFSVGSFVRYIENDNR